MLTLKEFLSEALVGNKVITNTKEKKFKVVEKIDWRNEINVYVLVNSEDEYNELIEYKDFWHTDIEPIRKRIKLDVKFGDSHLLGITTGHVTGVLYDTTCTQNDKQYLTEIAVISADQFNIDYFRENKWLIKQ